MEKQVTMGMQEYQELLAFKESLEKKEPIVIHRYGHSTEVYNLSEAEIVKELADNLNKIQGELERKSNELIRFQIEKQYSKKWWQL